MAESDRLCNAIDWIDLSFGECDRTPRWAIEVGIRCHLSGMSFRDTSQFLGDLGVHRSHVAVHNWVHKAELQPISTLSADQLAVDEKTTRLHGEDIWLYGVLGIPDSDGLRESNALPNAVDPETNEMGIGTASDVSSER